MADEETVTPEVEVPAAPAVEEAPAEVPATPAAEVPPAPPAADPAPADAPDADASRTDFASKGLRPGDECVCPDGRKGTVHSFDAGLVCIPNADQH